MVWYVLLNCFYITFYRSSSFYGIQFFSVLSSVSLLASASSLACFSLARVSLLVLRLRSVIRFGVSDFNVDGRLDVSARIVNARLDGCC